MGIYYIKNLTNNKIYIGQSIDIPKRFNTHRHRLRNDFHGNSHLQSAFNKYGEENFEFGIIKVTKERYLNRLEKLYIKKYDSANPTKGYNHAKGGNSNSGWTMPQEVRDKIGNANKGKPKPPFTEEHRRNISNSLKGQTAWSKGKKFPQWSGENHHFYGKHHTEETKQKISETKKGTKLSEETIELQRELRSKYTLWDWKKVKYDKSVMFQRNREPNPCKCFNLMYNKKRIEIGRFEDFITPEIIHDIIKEEVEK